MMNAFAVIEQAREREFKWTYTFFFWLNVVIAFFKAIRHAFKYKINGSSAVVNTFQEVNTQKTGKLVACC